MSFIMIILWRRKDLKINKVEKLIPTLLKKEKYVLHEAKSEAIFGTGVKIKMDSSWNQIPGKTLDEVIY